jgi:hypothetical protein
VENYNNAIGSFETRVLTTARKFEELKAAPEAASITNLEPVDSVPRNLQSSSVSLLPATAPAPYNTAPLAFDPTKAAHLLEPEMDDDFTFVPDPPTDARNAASDLRSALD